MQGYLDEVHSSVIRGWFTPENKAILTINEHKFEIRNGYKRQDVKDSLGHPIESGFLLKPETYPQIFDCLKQLSGKKICVKLFSDSKLSHVLEPKNGIKINLPKEIFQLSNQYLPKEEDLIRNSGYSKEEIKRIKEHFYKYGFCILRSFYTKSDMQSYKVYWDNLWINRSNINASLDTIDNNKINRCIKFKDASLEDKKVPYKLNDLFLEDFYTRQISLSERLSSFLALITGGFIAQCNSLNLEFGSQQAYHFDSFYMPPPEDATQLIVSSICIEDVSEDAGPLSYWPKSHLCPPWINDKGTTHAGTSSEHEKANQHFLNYAEQNKLTPQTFKGEIGDVFIWHQQLYHGGLPIIDKKKTRRSLVNHYWSYPADKLPVNYFPVNSSSGFLQRDHKNSSTNFLEKILNKLIKRF